MQRLIKLMLNLRNLIEVLQDTKKNSKIHSKSSEQHEKKKIQIYQYILIQIWKRIKKKQISSSRPPFMK